MIQVEGLTYTYPGTVEPALSEVTLNIPSGQLCAVVGANGSGKSTLCYALTGFIPHFYRGTLDGRVHVGGRSIPDTPLADLAGEIGLVFQNPFNQITGARFTVLEEIAFGLENLGIPRNLMLERCRQALEMTGLPDLADRSPYALSGGQQQRLAIASIIAMRPRVLVLDEPTSQLDPAGTRDIFTRLRAMTREGETTVVVTEHKLEWVGAFADRVVALCQGRVVADGSPREVLTSSSIETWGIGQTRFTQAARGARDRLLIPDGRPLPVTLQEAIEFLQ